MLRAHRQAWAWQDEWFGLNMDDIRLLEKETQELLAKKMAAKTDEESQSDKVTSRSGSVNKGECFRCSTLLQLCPVTQRKRRFR